MEGAEQRVKAGSIRTQSASPDREGSSAGYPRFWRRRDLWEEFGREVSGWVVGSFCLFACLLERLFWVFFIIIFLWGFVCFPCWSAKVYFLSGHGGAKESPWVGISPALGVCTSPLSCWARGDVSCVFSPALFHSEVWSVLICTVPLWPASAEILEPHTHRMHTMQSSLQYPKKLRHTLWE